MLRLLRAFARTVFNRQVFLIFSLQSHIELLVSEMQIKLGIIDFVSEIKRVVKYPDFEKLAHV